jgi:hypothetical protein
MILWVRITKATGKVSKYFLFLVDQPKNKSEQGHTKINPKSIDVRVPIFAARTVNTLGREIGRSQTQNPNKSLKLRKPLSTEMKAMQYTMLRPSAIVHSGYIKKLSRPVLRAQTL